MPADAANPGASPPVAGRAPDPKRRKIRKGTRSCWDCKRRKIKCNYPSPSDATCEGCRRRGAHCVSQEFPEETSAPVGSSHVVGDRLGKMEALVEQLVKKIGSPTAASQAAELGVHSAFERAKPSPQGQEDRSTNPGLPTPNSLSADSMRFAEGYNNTAATVSSSKLLAYLGAFKPNDHKRGLEDEHLNSPGSQVRAPSPSTEVVGTWSTGKTPHDWGNLSRMLYSAFPSQHDVDIIVERSHAVNFIQALWLPYGRLFDDDAEKEIINLKKLPPPTAHPAVLGLRMLMLATFLEHVHPQYEPALKDLEEDWTGIRARLASLAVTYVVSRDELVGSVEGLACVLLAAVFQSNSGNLRRGWLTFRRAMNLGQLMGLNKPGCPMVRRLDPSTTADQQHVWFRINYADTMLSVMLGMPAGYHDASNVASEAAMQADNPMGRLERMHLDVARKIVQRNGSSVGNSDAAWEETQKLDVDLQTAARSMPPRWWTMSPHRGEKRSRQEILRDTLTMLNQFYHYSLLNQLHLPFMMASSPDRKFDYSRMTCVNAARELLSRFIEFRGANLVAFCCRCVDFIAFIASMSLLLAHLDAHHHGGPNNYLAHQRLSDRGMMEHVADTFSELYDLNADSVSLHSLRVLRRLLTMELDAANGASYSTSSDVHEGAVEGSRQPHESEDAVRFFVPYFGTIRIAKEGVTKTAGSEAVPDVATPSLPPPGPDTTWRPTGGPAPAGAPGSCQVEAGYGGPSWDWQAAGPPFGQQPLQPDDPGAATPPFTAGGFFDGSLAQHPLVPGLTAGTEDWAFQGVDLAFFDNLMRGQNPPAPAELPNVAPVAWGTWGTN